MDLAYDHIVEDSFPKENEGGSSSTAAASGNNTHNNNDNTQTPEQQSNLNADLQDAYRAFSNSPWGAKIGGFFGSVVKQGEYVAREAQKELTAIGNDTTGVIEDLRASLISRTRALSLTTSQPPAAEQASRESGDTRETTPTESRDKSAEDALEESETVLSRLRGEAAKRLKDLQKAEDAADEALLRFGSNLRDFLRDAIKIAPPTGETDGQGGNTVFFESKDAHGKRVIHTSRFDAQLHVIHTSPDSFSKDRPGQAYEAWSNNFDIDKKTEDISSDLAKYPDLRTTMEKLVPDQVPYADFWKRYYFLRHGIESAEARRRDLLKAASAEEEVGWDEDDSDDEGAQSKAAAPTSAATKADRPGSSESSTTIHPPAVAQASLKPSEPRKSNDEKSQADSDTSYDIVGARSGVPSQAPNSPRMSRKGDDSDEEDWE
ncbi:hypothetical protein B0H63DRAFT_200922 [Podospora didyma]|uniref:BSD domain-containing protein n=1 Tax=Podospora didyma TaxID=330526 RepID=A0AAE0NH53_9PEZI|nr:hypothetical protein B0H63DRAFT_200922 [Podospora didyma]